MTAWKSRLFTAAIAVCAAGGAFAWASQGNAAGTHTVSGTASAASDAGHGGTGTMSADVQSNASGADVQKACAGEIGADRRQCEQSLNRASEACASLSGNAHDDCMKQERTRASDAPSSAITQSAHGVAGTGRPTRANERQ